MMRRMYQLARARGQVLARSRLVKAEAAMLRIESALVRLLGSRVASGDDEAMPTSDHFLETYTYQLHVCRLRQA